MGRVFKIKWYVLLIFLFLLISCRQNDGLYSEQKPVAVKASQFKKHFPNSLADYQEHVIQYQITAQRGEMNILIIEADSPRTADTIIFFNGLSQILPDWPPIFIKQLVGKYNLLFMDYPGIGGTQPIEDNMFNFVSIAHNINGILNLFPNEYSNITGEKVHLVGWSLGTLVALKSIKPLSKSREVNHVILFSTKPGGEGALPLGTAFGNASPCVKSIAVELSTLGQYWYEHLARTLKKNLFQLLFPYKGQPTLDSSSAYIDCTLNTKSETLEVEMAPEFSHQYDKIGWLFLKNRIGGLWHGGIPNNVYIQERKTVGDWDRYSELDKHYHIDNASGNDAICQTKKVTLDRVISICPNLSKQVSHIKVVHAKKDLFIQYRYGQSLVDALNIASPNIASLALYDNAGHGYFLQESYQLTPNMFK
ncbi:alpha/beta hydrolase [uncultured Shewanella sp.]|uniref:alpha/beta hydrolase n=1 Tax=uncultured Shewanella sp. TaxID=173975 RepID=UPI0026121519|nr:alpha/beta hydrolase [uncultured Shewanella sp.]